MLTRREVVVEKPFQDRRYKDHRRKVMSALPRIDTGPPVEYPHLVVKLKKLRLEKDRQGKICEDNLKLAHRMAIIMRTKRLDNINMAPKGPFERRSKSMGIRDRRREDEPSWSEGGSLLQQVTTEAERCIRPPPPGRMVQHRAPAGVCRVPRVGPPPPAPPLPRRHLVPTITLPLSSPRSRRSPSPNSVSGRSSSRRRGRETTRLTPLSTSVSRRPSVSTLPSQRDENSSSAGDGGDFEEYCSDDVEKSDASNEEDGKREKLEDEEELKEKEKTEGVEEEVTDSDDHVSSVLLSHHPNITIDEASDDEFYS
uniref:Uncharacterized protein n=1 Tax=Scylla olivacea TaxID=85551 RepID=A0A0N7ZDB0_SCYOL